MFKIFDGHTSLPRRQFLNIGSLGLGGLSLATLLATKKALGERAGKIMTGKSVVFLFQQGGPSQLETYDPKPNAPSGVRTMTDVIPTSVPGVSFGSTLEKLAERMDKLAIVRSFQTKNAGHNIQPIVGPDSLETNIGSHYSRVVGATRPKTGVPTNAVLFPKAVCDDVPGPQARGNLSATGSYGEVAAPFVPGAGGELQDDMELHLPRERFFEDRRRLLAELDRLQSQAGSSLQAVETMRDQAYELLLGGKVSEALDLSRESQRVLDRYDTTRFGRPKDRWNKVNRGKRGYYTAQAESIGKLLLTARRLCEAGCGFVTIHASYSGVWDMHADRNNLNMHDGMKAVGRPFDHAVSAFIDDLEERGLQDDVLLVACGEMGRTPKINKRGGRDHWSRLAPLLLYGGGIQGGQVIGQSTRDGGEPATDNLDPSHLISTIMHTLFDVGELRLVPGIPAPVMKLCEADPIPLNR